MITYRWAMIDHQYIPEPMGFFLIVTTAEPCHLWCRWTYNFPEKHYIATTRRGLATLKKTYRCFNLYKDIRQIELGDTLIHKFHLSPLKFGLPVNFYYWGKVLEMPSPSETCLFTLTRYHSTGHPVESWTSVAMVVRYVSYYIPRAQTFTAPITFDLTQIGFLIKRMPTNHKVTFEVRTTTPAGYPGDHVLSSVTFPNLPPDWSTTEYQRRFVQFPPCRITKGYKAAICIWGDPDYPTEDQLLWRMNLVGAQYDRGHRFDGNFAPPNATWTKWDAGDFYFEVWGHPPGVIIY